MRRPVGIRIAIAALAAIFVGASCFGVVAVAGAGTEGEDLLGPGPVTVLLEIDHSTFSFDRIDVEVGTEVRFVVVNDDPIIHELIVGDAEVHERHESGHEAAHDPVPGEVTVEPGEIASTTFSFDEPGAVVLACHLPGHLDFGMVGTVVVHA